MHLLEKEVSVEGLARTALTQDHFLLHTMYCGTRRDTEEREVERGEMGETKREGEKERQRDRQTTTYNYLV